MDDVQKLAVETVEKNKQAIIFLSSRASAEKTSEDIAKFVKLEYLDFAEQVLKAGSVATKQCKRLAGVIKRGVAFHHAGLLQKQKDLIEQEFKRGKIRIICATPTLAAGLSLPVFRVIIKTLKRYSGKWGMDWIPVLEYLQMAGRAGRPEYEAFGEAIAIAKNDAERDEIFEKYICGVPEEIYSKLAVEPVLRTYLLSLIASGIIRDENGMLEFFSKTFWAQQFEDMPKLERIMDKMLGLLEEWNFITVLGGTDEEVEGFSVASSLGKEKKKDRRMRATMLGKRVSELYLDPLTARHLLDCVENFNDGNDEFSLLQMICHTLEMRPLLRIKVKQQEKIDEGLMQNYEKLLEKEPSAFDIEYPEFMQSIKTTMFFMNWIDEQHEDYLLEEFDIRPGEIRVKLETADWLLYGTEELCKILEKKEVVSEIQKLRVRVKHGVKEELIVLLKLKGVGRVRARKMFFNGLRTLGDLKRVDISSLGQIVGKAVAVEIKKQLGEEVKEVPKGTRKGQLSMGKFVK